MHELLRITRVENVMTPVSNLMVVHPTDDLRTCLNLFAQKHISSAPVYDRESGKWFGFVDLMDIACYVLAIYVEEKTLEIAEIRDPSLLKERFSTKVLQLIDASKVDPFVPIDANQSLASLICGPFREAIHRAVVVKDGVVIGMITQTDVVRWMKDNYKDLLPLLQKKVDEVVHAEDKGTLHKIHGKQPLVKAIAMIAKFNVPGVAVIDSQGKIIGNISASDLEGLTEENFHQLETGVDDLLQDSFYRMPPVFSMGDIMLYELIEMMINRKIHRIYITNAEGVPLYVCTLTTVLRIIARSFPLP